MILIILLILVVTVLYWKMVNHYNYWTNNGIKQRKQIYFIGDNRTIVFRKESMGEAIISMYNAFPNESCDEHKINVVSCSVKKLRKYICKCLSLCCIFDLQMNIPAIFSLDGAHRYLVQFARYMGIYQMTLPTLLIRDPELIKQITVKDFDYFLNHRAFIPEGLDPLWNKNLFALKDTEWHEMRSTLSPSFTSSKMKMMFSLISDCANEFTDCFLKTEGEQILEMKDTFTRYTNDVIASVAFGIKCDSIRERDNQFYNMGRKATMFDSTTNWKFLIYLISPKLSKILGITFFPKDVITFFLNVINDTIRVRESQGIVRPDMLNLLLEARHGKRLDGTEINDGFDTRVAKQHLTNMDIAAQAMVFFFGGFDSVSTLMTYSAYELALHPELQRKLQDEIDDTLDQCKGRLTYDALMKMKYMDMVISEVLRKWPAGIFTDRVCSKSYTVTPVHRDEKPVHLKPGDLVWIPIIGIHYDPKYFPNPFEFDPERFNDENKVNIKPYTYLPFGCGPRNCIGSRFALMEAKIILFYMLLKYDFLTCSKTDIPVKLSKTLMQLVAENGVWLEIKPRIK